MVNKRYYFILTVFCLCITSIVAADVSTSIDRNPVRVNETFELTLHMDSSPVSRPPLKGLPEELEVIRSSNFYQRSSINGKTEVQAGWRFTLKAVKEGVFTIPAFNIDGKSTLPLQIKILPPVNKTNINGQQDAIQLKATVDSNNVYVQQQITYTIRLYRAVQAQYASLSEPEMTGALLERLGEDRQFETEIDGVRYIVLERQYVIFPQEHGIKEISPVIFSAEVSSGQRQFSTFGRLQSRTKAISLSTDSIEITVKKQPQTHNNWWLPASKISLTEHWQPEPPEFRVGKPVTWSYTIVAQGLTATQLPELLPTEIKGLKLYPDTAQSENQPGQNGITGSRTQKIAVVPAHAGILTIPELMLSWWDVKQDKAIEITLPARTIEVLPSLDGDYGQLPDRIKAPETVTNTEHINLVDNDSGTIKTANEVKNTPVWKVVALISLLLWIILALYLFLRKTLPPIQVDEKQKSQNRNTALSTMGDIQHACKSNSAKAARKSILGWCKAHKKLKNIQSLSDLARNLSDDALSKQIKLLEWHLYAANQDEWKGENLLPLLKGLNNLSNEDRTIVKTQLPPLHPES